MKKRRQASGRFFLSRRDRNRRQHAANGNIPAARDGAPLRRRQPAVPAAQRRAMKSLHLLPECIEELQRPVDPAPAMQPEADPDVVLARRLQRLWSGPLDLLLHGWQPKLFPGALKTAVERFRAMTVERQRNVLGLFDTPVYKLVRRSKVRGSLQPDPEEQWPAEELFRAGSDTEAEDEVGNAEAVREEPLQVQEAGWEVLESGSDTDSDAPVPPVTSDSDEATEASDVDEENEQARQNPDVRVEPEVGDGRDVPATNGARRPRGVEEGSNRCDALLGDHEAQPDWAVAAVRILGRWDCCNERLDNWEVRVGDNPDPWKNPRCGPRQRMLQPGGRRLIRCSGEAMDFMQGRFVGVVLPGGEPLTLCEVEAFTFRVL